MTKGILFAIEEFAVHDGPGIRKTVFFKGCPLHCMWCHNPEGISFQKELMISKVSCINCGRCAGICSEDKCAACGKCVGVCPLRLRKVCGREIGAKELAEELLAGKDILEKSGGGITFSGGEPLAQPEFLLEVINELKPVHIAIETSGHAPSEVFRKAVNEADLILFDVKHTDPRAHESATGVDNTLILENLQYLCGTNKKFRIRIPLIPGINDSRENMERTARLVKDAGGLERVELLPYHKTAGAKYRLLGKVYDPPFDVDKEPCAYPEVFEKYDIRSVVL